MHPGAFEFISRFATTDEITVIEIGSRDINGSIREHFPGAYWLGLDLHPGPCVDVVCDAMQFVPGKPVDLVVCCEVFEHVKEWPDIIARTYSWISPGGRILITAAGPDREPHSAIDGGELRPGEHYENLTEDRLAEELHFAGFDQIETSGNEYWRDVYAVAARMN